MSADEKLAECERKIASELGRMQFEKLDREWIKEVIDNDFLQCPDLPLAYEEFLNECNIATRTDGIQNSLASWVAINRDLEAEEEVSASYARQSMGGSQLTEATVQPSNRGALFWQFLSQEEKIDVQSILALVGYLIDRGVALASDSQERLKCFSAAKLYFTMVCIPGSMAFGVFHQMLYGKALQLIQLYVQASKYGRSHPPSSQSARRGQKQAPHTEVEVDDEEEAPIGPEDIALIEGAFPGYVATLSLVSQCLSFKRYPNILKETIESVLSVLSCTGRERVCRDALEVVQHFCSPLHGEALQTVHHVFAHILPYLALDPNEKDLNNRNLICLKEMSFDLVRNFIDKFGQAIYPLVKGLIKHVCTDVVDRAEYRQRTAQTALDLLELLPADHRQDSIRWILLLAHAEQAFLRLFSMEIFSLMLQQAQVNMLLLAVIFSQCSDASATVRAKALAILGECIESNHPTMVEMFDIIFREEQASPEHDPEAKEDDYDILELIQKEEPIVESPALLPSAHDLLSLLKERAVDDKVYVRKNALQLLLTIGRRHERFLDPDLLKLLGNSCRDVALLIRRHMAQMLTDLVLQHPENESVQRTWSRSVLPLVLDGEARVQEKALECADELILRAISGRENSLGWSLLDVIIGQGLSTYLSKAMEIWSRQQQNLNSLLRTLQDNAELRGQAALTLIAIIARFIPIDNTTKRFVLDYFQEHIASTDPASIYCLQQVYKIIGATLPSMTKEQQQTIRTVSSRHVSSFHFPTDVIAPACDMVVFCIQQQVSDEDAARNQASAWARDIMANCGEFLSSHLRKQEFVQPDEEEQIARRICTLGCVALHCPKEVNKRHFLMLQHAAFQPESGVDAPIPTSQSQAPTRKLPARLQAASVIALGKLSVQHEEMAKQLIPGLGRLLETTPHQAIRNNVVCILCDWVVRYSTAIDPVMPQVTACLRDPSPEVKKQALVLLIHLLQEDYLKIRGTFFFRILQLSCDDDENLRDLSLFYVTQRLLHRQPTIIQQHFIESIFHFNDYKGHPTYNKFALTDRERKLFSIAGPLHAGRRFQIYLFMLQTMDDEARFQLTFRLTRDVLNGVVEDVMSLKNACTEAVLKDALAVLSSDDIKLASLSNQNEDDPAEKEDIAHAIVQSTKKAIIAQVVKRNVIENVVPIVVALKRKLAACKSPLMGKLMQFLRELMKDYKGEIEEVLAEDRQLMAEIDFDLKRFEQQERLEAGRQSTAPRADQTRTDGASPKGNRSRRAGSPRVSAQREQHAQPLTQQPTGDDGDVEVDSHPPDIASEPLPNVQSDSELDASQPAKPEAMTSSCTGESPVRSSKSPERQATPEPTTAPKDANDTQPEAGTDALTETEKGGEHGAAQRRENEEAEEPGAVNVRLRGKKVSLPPPVNATKTRTHAAKARLVSTPKRKYAAVQDVSFHIPEAELSAIPYPDQEGRDEERRRSKRRRR